MEIGNTHMHIHTLTHSRRVDTVEFGKARQILLIKYR